MQHSALALKHCGAKTICRTMIMVIATLGAVGCMTESSDAKAPKAAPTQNEKAAALSSRSWELLSLDQSGTRKAFVARVTLKFEKDGRISGSGGCNRYFATYKLSAKKRLTIGEIGRSKRMCLGDVMAQENAFLDILKRVNAYAIVENRLQLFYDDGRDALLFR